MLKLISVYKTLKTLPVQGDKNGNLTNLLKIIQRSYIVKSNLFKSDKKLDIIWEKEQL